MSGMRALAAAARRAASQAPGSAPRSFPRLAGGGRGGTAAGGGGPTQGGRAAMQHAPSARPVLGAPVPVRGGAPAAPSLALVSANARTHAQARRHAGLRQQQRNHGGGNTFDEEEVRKFGAIGQEWWNRNGQMKALHSYNKLRVSFLRNMLVQHFRPAGDDLGALRVVDVGCGGGILAEDLCRLGLDVTGIDAAPENIEIARAHAKESELLRDASASARIYGTGPLQYRHISADALASEGGAESYDAVVCSEVVEHVSDLKEMVRQLCALVKPNGAMMITTINRTKISYALSIVAAEHVLGIVPPGTHDWDKYVTPEELTELLAQNGVQVERVIGAVYNTLTDEWYSAPETSVNYLVFATKK